MSGICLTVVYISLVLWHWPFVDNIDHLFFVCEHKLLHRSKMYTSFHNEINLHQDSVSVSWPYRWPHHELLKRNVSLSIDHITMCLGQINDIKSFVGMELAKVIWSYYEYLHVISKKYLLPPRAQNLHYLNLHYVYPKLIIAIFYFPSVT